MDGRKGIPVRRAEVGSGKRTLRLPQRDSRAEGGRSQPSPGPGLASRFLALHRLTLKLSDESFLITCFF